MTYRQAFSQLMLQTRDEEESADPHVVYCHIGICFHHVCDWYLDFERWQVLILNKSEKQKYVVGDMVEHVVADVVQEVTWMVDKS